MTLPSRFDAELFIEEDYVQTIPGEEHDIYHRDYVETLLDDDGLSSQEAGFMFGYDDT